MATRRQAPYHDGGAAGRGTAPCTDPREGQALKSAACGRNGEGGRNLGVCVRDKPTPGSRHPAPRRARKYTVFAPPNPSLHLPFAPQVRTTHRIINQDPPATSHPDVVKAVADSAAALGLTTKHMVSRAYHDSLFMAR